MGQKQILLAIIGVCVVVGFKATDQPQRIFNRIDYPVGVRLRVKRISPKPPIPDTIQVIGYYQDKVKFRILSAYEPLNTHSGIYSNDVLHGYYLPLK